MGKTRLFGTDGIRGNAGTFLTARKAFDLGIAGARVLARGAKRPSILIGADPRISSDMLAAALAAGSASVGVDVHNAGVVPTPAVAYLVRKYGHSAGVMVSASHNAFKDNGIKFYNGQGYKLSDEIEDEIEAAMDGAAHGSNATGEDIGRILSADKATEDYAAFLRAAAQGDFADMRIALDCANGAAYKAAPLAFGLAEAEVTVLADAPNGININENCGSTHVEVLAEFVKNGDFDMGFAFDGDGDRCFAVDENGGILDGDMLMAMIGKHWQKKGVLAKNTIVATVMSNLGFFMDMEKAGLAAEQTQVGDRYVLERMVTGGFNLGGEQSGHIICLDHHTTGDGILTAMLVASIAREEATSLSQLNTMQKFPQVLKNARIAHERKETVLADAGIKAEIAALDAKFAGRGRVLIRPSGTEALIRVMLEGEDLDEITAEAARLARMMEEIAK